MIRWLRRFLRRPRCTPEAEQALAAMQIRHGNRILDLLSNCEGTIEGRDILWADDRARRELSQAVAEQAEPHA